MSKENSEDHPYECSAPRAPTDGGGHGMDGAHHSDSAPHELTYVDMGTFLANF